jgi:pimeloyl-ACP methyl ester carboxylesterase
MTNATLRGTLISALVALAFVMPTSMPLSGAVPNERPTAAVKTGPRGDDFYHPPASLVPGAHGTVIWARQLTGGAALPGANNWLVLYRSRTPNDEPVAVSGTVAVPSGPAPAQGWPVMSWGHGTTGVADVCAPSRDSETHPAHDYVGLVNQTNARWVERGYAVAQTDYQGLGTDGDHGYLIGVPEARAAADLVLAAHKLSKELNKAWVANGHSQGGQAALFAAEIGQAWAPQLDLRGAVALAPGSNYREVFELSEKSPIGNGSGFSLVIRGVETATDLRTREILTERAWQLLPHTEDRCIAQLRQPDSWGGLKSNEVFRSDADLYDFHRVIDENDPKHVAPTVPVFLAHGGQDQVAPHAMSDALYAQQAARGTDIEYRLYPDQDHRGVVAASFEDVLNWTDARVGY